MPGLPGDELSGATDRKTHLHKPSDIRGPTGSTGATSADIAPLDSVAKRETAVGEVAYLTSMLAQMLVAANILDPNFAPEGISLQDIMDRFDTLTK